MAGVKEQIAALHEGICLYRASNFPEGDEGMTIDISKIKPGDKVTPVPLEVIRANPLAIMVGLPGGGGYSITPDQIAAHHPAPREFQVGDRVGWDREGSIGDVVGTHGTNVWVNWHGVAHHPIWPASALTLVGAGQ